MKKILAILLLSAFFTLGFVNSSYSQDQWTQGKPGIYSVGIGGTDAIAVGNPYGNGYVYNAISPSGLSINASGEYKVYKFIGLGWQTGLDFFFYPGYYYYNPYGPSYRYAAAPYIGIPLIIKANVHILDAIGGIAIANKLDVYAGLNLGGGPAFGTATGEHVVGFIQVGPTVGVRYWFNPKVAVFGEFGWGATFGNVGLSF